MGGCKAIVQDPTSETDTCLIACGDAKDYIVNDLFKMDTYTLSTVTPSQFTDKYTTFSAYGNAAVNQCRQVEFMQVLDQRSSKLSYTLGLATSLATQGIQFNAKGNKLAAVVKNFKSDISAGDWESFGTHLYGFISNLVTYTAPAASVGTSPN